jgi:hypothetical protein
MALSKNPSRPSRRKRGAPGLTASIRSPGPGKPYITDYGYNGGAKADDAQLLSLALQTMEVYGGHSLLEELHHRGYDLSTFRFSISLREPADPDAPSFDYGTPPPPL